MTDAADIRRAIERAGLRGFARRSGCPPAAVQRLVKRGAYPERGPHGEAMRAAVAEVLAEPEAASPDAGGGRKRKRRAAPAVPNVPNVPEAPAVPARQCEPPPPRFRIDPHTLMPVYEDAADPAAVARWLMGRR